MVIENLPDLPENCISEFLGDVSEHPSVINSKLTNEEKNNLDRELTINEFDMAVKDIKTKSSPGLDGVSNKFIKKFWYYFRAPLFDYTKFCLERGELTESFKTAKIKLIPKKGNLKKIGNWRPISLLNCFYKLISKVITNRIRTVFDKITHVGQKGYSKKKLCQEAIFPLIDSILGSKKLKKKGCIVSVDIKKAFDSLSHDFMVHTLQFFNFGENIVNWIKTICTGRKACIILNPGKLGPNFDLERGNAQGDVISPFIFNICYQILIFKIEFHLQIEKINLPVPPILNGPYTGTRVGQDHRTEKVFVFADDCNILTTLDPQNLEIIKQILDNFGAISGLTCNLQKSNILPIGPVQNITPELQNTGFNFVTQITVLGFELTNDDVSLITLNTDKILGKIVNQIRFWSKLKLSLPGRINICKTMLYSQLNYVGCVLPVPANTVEAIENAIHLYASGNLRLAKKRVFLPIKLGGLGLFDVKNFLDAQKCSWLRHCKIIDQNWKLVLANSGSGNLFNVTEKEIDREINLIPYEIARAYRSLIVKFTGKDHNYMEAFILNNEALPVSVRRKDPLRVEDLDPEIIENNERMLIFRNLKIKNLMEGGTFINKPTFCRLISFNVSRELWEKLDKIRRVAKTKFGSGTNETAQSFENFFNAWKSGSKKARNILDYDPTIYIAHNMIKFAENTEIVVNLDLSKKLNMLWTKPYFSNDTKTFIFKMHNNTIALNTVVSHFVRGVGRNCTFCDYLRNPEEEDETLLHLMYNCTPAESIRNNIFKQIMDDELFMVHRREFFGEFNLNNNFDNEMLMTVSILMRKFFWDCKVRKIIPTLPGTKSYISGEIQTMRKISTTFDRTVAGCNLRLNFLF
jgi:hypothetical protein